MIVRTTTARAAQPARHAMTLMELMVVMAIIIVLAGAAVPIYLNYLENAKIDRARTDVKNVENAITAYYARQGNFPESLAVLAMPGANGQLATFSEENLVDPWGQFYQYDPNMIQPGTARPRVWTVTPSGDEIANWYQ